MKKRENIYIVFLLIALVFAGFLIVDAINFFRDGGDFSEFIDKGGNVILSLKDQSSSIIDNISRGNSSDNNNENINNNGNSSSGENNIIEKVVSPAQEVINNTKDNTIEKVEYIREEVEKIVGSVTAPINQTTNSLAKQLISWLLSLLSPEEIREIFAKDFDIDICR
ncbi:MAG: hypothetical protein XE08_0568 [Parcubacteria bacterium 32_520]|nr:MAG: hypothetical protein XD75_0556 [Parcubacteria bacterium 33_209]KUK98375.1 MAG: hypothetical protein XE08_0568 [Parcubacteria bacterium 32_520]